MALASEPNQPSALASVRDMGERYRREMLAHGGAKEPMLMVEGNADPLFNVSPQRFARTFVRLKGKKPFVVSQIDLRLVRTGVPPVYLSPQLT